MKVPATTPARGAAARLRLQLVISPGPGRFIFTVVLERSRHLGSALYTSTTPLLLNTAPCSIASQYTCKTLSASRALPFWGAAVPEWRLASESAPARAPHSSQDTRAEGARTVDGGRRRPVAPPRVESAHVCTGRATVYRVKNNQVQTQQRLHGNPGQGPCHSAARHTRTVSQV